MKRMHWIISGGYAAMMLASAALGANDNAGPKPANDNPGVKAGGDLGIKPVAGDKTKAVDLSRNLSPPELTLKLASQIGLQQSKADEIRAILDEAQPRLDTAQQHLRADTEALANLLKADKPDIAACLTALDKELDDERQVKHLNMEVSLKVRALLTPQQAAQVAQLALNQKTAQNAVPEALKAKMQQVMALAQQRLQEGKDLSGVKKLMEEAKQEATAGQYPQAAEHLDQALKILNP